MGTPESGEQRREVASRFWADGCMVVVADGVFKCRLGVFGSRCWVVQWCLAGVGV